LAQLVAEVSTGVVGEVDQRGSPETVEASAIRGGDARDPQEDDQEFREGAVQIVEETNKPIAQVARDLGVNGGTLGNWVARAREAREGTQGLSAGDVEELKRLRAENAKLRMQRDVLKRSVVLWVKEATK
jgi:transposase